MLDIFTKKEKIVSFFSLFFICLVYSFFFLNGKFPLHDNRASYEIFYTFHNSILNYRELALWFPQIQNGLISDNYLISFLSIPDLLSILLGFIFNIKETLLIYYFSITLQLFILSWGAYLLTKILKLKTYSAIFFCLTLLFSVEFMWQSSFNLRLFLYLPITGYFIHQGVTQKNLKPLLLSFLSFSLSLFGIPAYFLFPVALFTLSCLLASMWENNVFSNFEPFMKDIFMSFKKNIFINITLIFISITLLIIILSILIHVQDDIGIISNGRLNDGSVVLQQFLSYGFSPSFSKLFELIFVIPSNPDAMIFMGYCPLVLFILSLIVVRRPYHVICCLMTLILICLSVGDGTAIPAFLYHFFPTAKFYRHIGLLIPTIHFYGLLCAAMGLETLQQKIKDNERKEIFKILNIIVLASIIFICVCFLYYKHRWPYEYFWMGSIMHPEQMRALSFLSLIILFILIQRYKFIGFSNIKSSFIAKVFILLSLFELTSYTFYLNNRIFFFPISDIKQLIQPRFLDNNLWREQDYSKELMSVMNALDSSPGAKYSTRDIFEGSSLCDNKGRNDLISKAFYDLQFLQTPKIEHSKKDLWEQARIQNIGDNAQEPLPLRSQFKINKLLGCVESELSPKLDFIDLIYSNNFYTSSKPNSSIIFQLNMPKTVQGFQIKKLSFDGKKITFFASNDKHTWQKLYSYRNTKPVLEEQFISFWFEQNHAYKFYKIQFIGSSISKRHTRFESIELRSEKPMGFLTNDIKIYPTLEAAQKVFIKHYKQEIPKITASSQHQNFGPETLMTDNSIIWHSKPPFKQAETLYFDYKTPQTVNQLHILPQDVIERAPSSFSFLGSNDKKQWFELLSVKKSSNKPKINEWLKYQIQNPQPFSHYRLVITDNYGDPDLVTIRSLKMNMLKKQDEFSNIIMIKSNLVIINSQASEKKFPDSIVMLERSYNHAKMLVHSKKGSWLIWREPYNPNWKITVDGKQQDYTRADIAFIATPITAGSHEVNIEFMGNSHFKTKFSIVIVFGIIGFLMMLIMAFL